MVCSCLYTGLNKYVSDKSIRLATLTLSKCAGFSGMAGGQMIDISSNDTVNNFDLLKKMHSLKTGALIRCAMLLGYYASSDNNDEQIISKLEEYATNLGIAFQIRDDILDKISSNDVLGKPVGSDAINQKTTSLSFMSTEKAQSLVDELTREAITIITGFYEKTAFKSLVELAKYMVNRDK